MQDIRKTPEYRRCVNKVKRHDRKACRRCGFDKNLSVHHIMPVNAYPEFACEVINGLTLCGNCHIELKNKELTTNLIKFIKKCPHFHNGYTVELLKARMSKQLKILNAKLYAYLERQLNSSEERIRNAAVDSLFVQFYTYPSSLGQFLSLIEHNFQTVERYFQTAAIQLTLFCDEILKAKIGLLLQTFDSETKSAETYFRWGYTKVDLKELLKDGIHLQRQKRW